MLAGRVWYNRVQQLVWRDERERILMERAIWAIWAVWRVWLAR